MPATGLPAWQWNPHRWHHGCCTLPAHHHHGYLTVPTADTVTHPAHPAVATGIPTPCQRVLSEDGDWYCVEHGNVPWPHHSEQAKP